MRAKTTLCLLALVLVGCTQARLYKGQSRHKRQAERDVFENALPSSQNSENSNPLEVVQINGASPHRFHETECGIRLREVAELRPVLDSNRNEYVLKRFLIEADTGKPATGPCAEALQEQYDREDRLRPTFLLKQRPEQGAHPVHPAHHPVHAYKPEQPPTRLDEPRADPAYPAANAQPNMEYRADFSQPQYHSADGQGSMRPEDTVVYSQQARPALRRCRNRPQPVVLPTFEPVQPRRRDCRRRRIPAPQPLPAASNQIEFNTPREVIIPPPPRRRCVNRPRPTTLTEVLNPPMRRRCVTRSEKRQHFLRPLSQLPDDNAYVAEEPRLAKDVEVVASLPVRRI